MSDTTDNGIRVPITGSVSGLVSAMGEGAVAVKEGTASMTESIEAMTATVEAALGPLIAIAALLESGEIFHEAIEKTADLAVQLEVLSQKTGLGVEQLSALKYAAEISHVTIEEFSIGMQRLARGMGEAQKQTGPAYEALKALGIAAVDSTGHLRPMDTVLLQLATRFSTMQDGAGKTALAMELFGRSGANLIPFLNQGAAGIADLEKEAARLGITMNEKDVSSAVAYEEAMKNLHGALEGVERQMALGLMPALSSIATAMTEGEHATSAFRVVGQAIGVVFRIIATTAELAWTQLTIYADVVKAIAHLTNPWTAIKKDATDAAEVIKQIWSTVGEKPAPPTGNGTAPPVLGPKGASTLEQWREEWNKIKQGKLGSNDDLLFIEINFWQRKLAIAEKGSKDYIDIDTHLTSLLTELDKRQRESAKKTQKELEDSWVSVFHAIPQAWDQAVRSLKNSTASWGDFFRELLRDLASEYAAFELKSIVIHNAAWLEKKKITLAGYASEALAAVANTIVVVAQYAYQAAAAAWAAVAGIPVVGPYLAPAVAAATLAGVLALAHGGGGGGGSVPSASTHSSASAGGGGGGGGGGNTFIYAIDTKSFHEVMMRNAATVSKAAIAGGASGVRLPASPGRGSA